MSYRQALGPSEEQLAAQEEQAAAAQLAAQAAAEKSSAFQTLFDDPSYWGSGEGDYATWDPSAGLQFKDPTGGLRTLGHGEHAESDSYLQAAAADPMYDRFIAYANQHEGSLTPEQQQLLTLGGGDTWGQSKMRSWGAIDPYATDLTGHQAGTMLQAGRAGDLTPEQRQSGEYFNWYESPAQQSARSDDGGMFGSLGDIGKLAMLAAAIYSGGASAGLWGAGEAAAAGLGEAALGETALGSLGSGMVGVELPAAGLYGTTPMMAGGMGSGLAGTTAASLVPAEASLGSTLASAASGLNKVRPLYNAASSLNSMLNPAERPQTVSGLRQVAQQPQRRGGMSQAFGNRNFNQYT